MGDESQTVTNPRPSLAPMLSVCKGARAVEFYQAALEFWVADESPEHLNFSPETLGGATFRMVLVVDNPDAVFAQAIAAAATAVSPVGDHSYGWRLGRVADPFGHHWEIGKAFGKAAKPGQQRGELVCSGYQNFSRDAACCFLLSATVQPADTLLATSPRWGCRWFLCKSLSLRASC